MEEELKTEEPVQEELPSELSSPLPTSENQPSEAEEDVDVIDYAAQAAADLAEIKRLAPHYAPATHLSELPFAYRFAELRELGLSVSEALGAVSPFPAVKDSRAHLRSMTPRGMGGTEAALDRAQMKEAKLLFSGLSEGEINALFRRVSRKEYD